MRSTTAALLMAGALLLAGVAAATLVPNPMAASPDEGQGPGQGMTMGAPHHAHGGAGAHDYHGGTGTIPDLVTAMTKLQRRTAITIGNDSQWNPANGVRGGSGTYEDPFVISGWYVDTILIKDTSRAFELKENYVSNILVLDWTGDGGYVHHNHLENMRTNRNVARTGDPSATVIENNDILRVEQLRHFDGEVRNNTIGQPGLTHILQRDVIFDIAGLNGAGIHDNVIYGGVDMKLHGHHHADHDGGASHNHGTGVHDDMDDHQVRYIDFEFYRNRIVDDGFGLRYNDLNHAGDDRTATSEQEPDLEKPHVHHTTIRLHDNVIDGATLRVAVVNAQDERHVPGESAVLELADNQVLEPAAGDGIFVQVVRDALVLVHGNVVEKGPLQLQGTSGIRLAGFSNSTIVVGGNTIGDYVYGIRASGFDALTRWTVLPNDAPGVDYPVYWDSSVANAPEGAGAPEAPHEGHGHEATDAALAALTG
jgi:hypothetical protein